MRRLLVTLSLATLAFSAFALPSVDDVQAEVGKGNYAHAEELMREVVAARPGSARAHYVYAEILAHDKRFDLAAEEFARAKAIDPALKFTQAEKSGAFARLLEQEQAAARRPLKVERAATPVLREAPAAEPAGRGVPGWVWALGLAAAAALAWRAFGARRQAALAGGPVSGAPFGAAATGYGPAYSAPGMPGTPAATGSGLLGTGLAVAGGVAAGMLAEKLLGGHHDATQAATSAPGLNGLVPGMFDDAGANDAAARELDQRQVDFGSGDSWDSDGGGTSDDGGGW
jgi:tetratricopeptide (TPR) repeat protein